MFIMRDGQTAVEVEGEGDWIEGQALGWRGGSIWGGDMAGYRFMEGRSEGS